MSQSFEEQVKHHLWLYNAPDYTAKGDAVNFFKFNAKQAIPILEKMMENNNDRAVRDALGIATKYLEDNDDDKDKGTFMSRNPDLF